MLGSKEIRRANLRLIVTEVFDGNQTKLAALLGDEPSLISRMLSDNPRSRKPIGDTKARKIEKAAGKPENWLDQPHHQAQMPLADYNVEAGPEVSRMVPVISWVQAGAWHEVIDNFQPGDAEEWLPSPVRCSPQTFVVRVRGESMEPRFHDGELIFVDPAGEARNKSFVVVRLDDSKEATFKQLIIEGDKHYLKPLNPHWPEPVIPINGRATICGVVIFKGERL